MDHHGVVDLLAGNDLATQGLSVLCKESDMGVLGWFVAGFLKMILPEIFFFHMYPLLKAIMFKELSDIKCEYFF